MEALSLFLWKSIVVSGLLTGWYWLGLRGRRLHQYNRIFLLSTLFVSLSVPFLHFQLFSIPSIPTGGFAPTALLLPGTVSARGALPSLSQQLPTDTDWWPIARFIAAAISVVLLMILSVRIYKVRRMCTQYPVTHLNGINLLLTDLPKAPFAFLKYLFWNKSVPLEGEVGQLILRHELTHIEQGHTYDKLISQALTCVFWFNPFYWVIQKELNIVHEFIADEQAVADRNTEAFAMMLLQSYSNGSYLSPQHHFFASPVKRRLAMLQTATRPSYIMFRRLAALPLIAGTILLFSFGSNNTGNNMVTPAKEKIVVVLDAGHGGKDAGEQAGGYTEKDINLRYAKRIKELSAEYNVEVQLTRNDDQEVPLATRVALADKIRPKLFITLHLADEPGKEAEKNDFDIYVSGANRYANKSITYSRSLFLAMEENGFIFTLSKAQSHVHSPGCNCSTCVQQHTDTAQLSATEQEGVYVLAHAQVPAIAMVLGNINNPAGMQQLVDKDKLDLLARAVLKGIVDGAAAKENPDTINPWAGLPVASGNAVCK